MSAPRWDREGRDWPNRVHSRFVDSGGLRWHVQQLGAGPAMLLLHGTGAATHSWRTLAPLLAERYAVTAIDLPGHGFTTGHPVGGMTMPAVARAIARLLTRLELAPHAIVGHSAGAAIAIRKALDGPIAPRAVVGLDAALLPFPGLGGKLFPTLAKLLFVNPFAPHILSRLVRTRAETARFLERSTGSRIDRAGVDQYHRLFATSAHCAGAIAMMTDWDLETLTRDLPRLTTPLLLIHGEADAAIPLSNARAAAALIPDARLTPLAGLGHLAHEERPEEVARLIHAFIGETA